jgi:predicted XRE-type DNA-binding protein
MTDERNADNTILESSGNVFADLGLSMSEDDMLKVYIARMITRVVQDGGYNQTEAGQAMGLDQPKVSKLLRGRLKEFKSDRLVECLLQLGYDLELKVKKSPRGKRGRIREVA